MQNLFQTPPSIFIYRFHHQPRCRINENIHLSAKVRKIMVTVLMQGFQVDNFEASPWHIILGNQWQMNDCGQNTHFVFRKLSFPKSLYCLPCFWKHIELILLQKFNYNTLNMHWISQPSEEEVSEKWSPNLSTIR